MTVLFIASVCAGPATAQPPGANRAMEPYVSDAAICNEEAHVATATPSAAPSDPQSLRPAPPLTPKPGMTLDRSGSIVVQSTDPWLEGMARQGIRDDAYRAAYRECIAQRLQRRR